MTARDLQEKALREIQRLGQEYDADFVPGWRVLAVVWGYEQWAVERLSEYGVEAREIRAYKRQRASKRHKKLVSVPHTIPGYCWAKFEVPNEREKVVDHIKERSNIYSILQTDGRDFSINDKRLAEICAIMRTEEFDKKVLEFVGQTVRINEGPFTGYSGEVESQTHKGDDFIIRVLLDLLGGKTPVEMDAEQVSKVA